MTYVKQTWHDKPLTDTPRSAARYTHQEEGIYDASVAAEAAQSDVDALTGTVATLTSTVGSNATTASNAASAASAAAAAASAAAAAVAADLAAHAASGSYTALAVSGGTTLGGTNGTTTAPLSVKARSAGSQTANNISSFDEDGTTVTFSVDKKGRIAAGRTLGSGSVAYIQTNEPARSALRLTAAPSQAQPIFMALDSNAAALWQLAADGIPQWVGSSSTQNGVGAAGGASAIPGAPAKWLKAYNASGVLGVIPWWPAS